MCGKCVLCRTPGAKGGKWNRKPWKDLVLAARPYRIKVNSPWEPPCCINWTYVLFWQFKIVWPAHIPERWYWLEINFNVRVLSRQSPSKKSSWIPALKHSHFVAFWAFRKELQGGMLSWDPKHREASLYKSQRRGVGHNVWTLRGVCGGGVCECYFQSC